LPNKFTFNTSFNVSVFIEQIAHSASYVLYNYFIQYKVFMQQSSVISLSIEVIEDTLPSCKPRRWFKEGPQKYGESSRGLLPMCLIWQQGFCRIISQIGDSPLKGQSSEILIPFFYKYG
jgi:hypothetical protein